MLGVYRPVWLDVDVYTDRFTRVGAVDGLLAAAFVLAWSSGFIGATLGTRAATALTLLMWRFLIAAALLALWSSRRQEPRLGARTIARQSVVGLLSQGVYLGATIYAIQLGVSAGIAALIAALQPLVAAALAGPVLGQRVARRQWLGLAVGLVGVAIVVSGGLTGANGVPVWAYALPFLATAGLVSATLLERRTVDQGTIAQGLTVQCAVSAVLFSLLAIIEGEAAPPATSGFWIAVVWVIVLSTFGGYGLYWINLRRHNITHVSSLIYLTPPTTLLWALVMFDQPISAVTIAGVAVCLVSVRLVALPSRARRRPSRDPGNRRALLITFALRIRVVLRRRLVRRRRGRAVGTDPVARASPAGECRWRPFRRRR